MNKVLLPILIIFFGLNMFAQEGPKVVVFNSSQNEREQSEVENIIKFGMLEPFSGSFSVYYERVLTKNISAEIGLGLTINDYLSLAVDDIDNLFQDDANEAKLGQAFSLGLRYYPNYIPEDFYIAPEFRFKRYLKNMSYTENSIDKTFNEKNTLAIGRITFGYHYTVYDNIFWDFFGGFGIAKVKQISISPENVTDPNSGTTSINFVENEFTGLKPKIHIGIKLGIGF